MGTISLYSNTATVFSGIFCVLVVIFCEKPLLAVLLVHSSCILGRLGGTVDW